jgi:heme oxygenase
MRMHGLKPFNAILEARLPLEEYQRLLQALFLYHSAIAAAAAQFGLSDLSSATRRLALLEADMRSIGATALKRAVEWKPLAAEEVLGALYAAEGSMLGGRVIAGQLDYLFGSSPQGRRFFLGSRDDGADWRMLLAALELRCTAPHHLRRAAAGALQSFQLFEYCVRSCCLAGSWSVPHEEH